MNEKIKIFCKQYLVYAAIAGFCVMYVLTAFIELEPTGKTIPMILADGFMAFAFGMGIASMFRGKGLANGAKEPCVAEAVNAHEQMAADIVEQDEMEDLTSWCEGMNAKNYKRQRTKILCRAGMTYHECFTEEGTVLPYKPLPALDEKGIWPKIERWRQEKIRETAYKKAVNLRLTELSSEELTSEGTGTGDPYYMERGKKKYRAQSAAQDAMSKTVTAIALGYCGVKLITEFSYETLIWNTVQVIFFLVLGSFKYTDAVSYMTEEYRERRTKKTHFLMQFKKEKGRDASASLPGKEDAHEQKETGIT